MRIDAASATAAEGSLRYAEYEAEVTALRMALAAAQREVSELRRHADASETRVDDLEARGYLDGTAG